MTPITYPIRESHDVCIIYKSNLSLLLKRNDKTLKKVPNWRRQETLQTKTTTVSASNGDVTWRLPIMMIKCLWLHLRTKSRRTIETNISL